MGLTPTVLDVLAVDLEPASKSDDRSGCEAGRILDVEVRVPYEAVDVEHAWRPSAVAFAAWYGDLKPGLASSAIAETQYLGDPPDQADRIQDPDRVRCGGLLGQGVARAS